MKRQPVAVIGLGNPLFQDEGAGLIAIAMLAVEYPGLPVDIISAGTPGFGLLHHFEEREKVIFIDAGLCEAVAGTFRRFTHKDVISIKRIPGYSIHEFDLITFLNLAEQMGFLKHTSVSVYCIQVGETGLSGTLSKEVLNGLHALIHSVYNEVNEYIKGITYSG